MPFLVDANCGVRMPLLMKHDVSLSLQQTDAPGHDEQP